ncbi:MAG: DoxX family membrane protein [Bacteroidales bacterium]|nr:DoxX family membrane protein [Bacteroidales bacterium]
MNLRGKTFHQADIVITSWMSKNGLTFLRISIGIIFFWFGVLKYFEGLSPAEGIAIRTIDVLTFHLLPERLIIVGLATWEVLIGIGLLLNAFMRETLLLLFLQMMGTFTPLFLFPSDVFHVFPIALTLEGQYIVKNIVLISAGIVLGATVRGGKLTPAR